MAVVRALLLTLILLPTRALAADIDPAFEADIRQLLAVTGAQDAATQAMAGTLAQVRQLVPGAPAAFWDRLAAELDTAELVELTVPIYARHFTHDEVRQLIAFWGSPIGQRFRQEQPALMQESMAAGQQWGAAIGERVMNEVRAAGYR